MAIDIKALTNKIQSATQITPDIVDALNELSAAQLDSDITAAYDLALSAIRDSRKLHYEAGEAMALINAGTCASRQHQYDEAISYFNEALHIKEKINDLPGIGTIYAKIGNTELRAGNYTSAFEYYNKASENTTRHQ